MIEVLDSAGMREADRETIENLGLPGLVLMEQAAAAVTDVVLERLAGAGRIAVVCGPGNNGGDGLACARQLRCRGAEVEIAVLVPEAALRGDAGVQLTLARRYGLQPVMVGDDLGGLDEVLGRADLIVDALFGTGLDRPLEGRWAEVVRRLNASPAQVVAVDVPSGLSGSSGEVPGEAVEAAVTVTFAAPKLPHVLPPACWRCGEVAVADIGIPPWVLEARAVLGVVELADVAAWLPDRPADAHKGRFGHLLVVAGRFGRAGAAALAARAAVVAGAGLVTVATAEKAVGPVQALVPEAMVDPLLDEPDGAALADGFEASLGKATALAVGPGMGTGEREGRMLEWLLEHFSGPLVLDADALTLLAERVEVLRGRSAPTVLTPHAGELGRLLGWPTARVVADRRAAARELAARSGAVVLAKGARSLVVGGGRLDLVNPTGSPGLATGGSGDVLTGLVGSLLAQGLGASEAAAAGAWLHGRAAELGGETCRGAVPASELVRHFPAAEAEARGARA
ncbi:MAG TPA: NAD(P)H-hydrate dehydratase [Thermoanaerobaculaceae bacterium]|nr:NAD(P)H-hydrate dehydratase [Thermoanaerobaculaceae bacterium]HRS17277.1 NAD(P)H-hydrate dehydratase [Thermoanaerobaculaceae bacterium]